MVRQLRDGFLLVSNRLLAPTLFKRRALLPAEGGSVPVPRVSAATRRLQHISAADLLKNPVICTRDADQTCFLSA